MPRATPWVDRMAPTDLSLSEDAIAAMRAELPAVAEQVVSAVRDSVPSYADPFRGEMGRNIENAVELALGGFLALASGEHDGGPVASFEQVSEAAYSLGRGEARSGRTMDALLSAYRVGARVAWRDMGGSAVRAGLPADAVARFAELVFDYIDELSASSAAGHADELATTGRVRQRYLEQLTRALLDGASPEVLEAAAERADWKPPRTLTAVLLPETRSRGVLAEIDPATLQPTDRLPGLEDQPDLAVLFVPNASGVSRTALLRRLRDRDAVVGPARPWLAAHLSYDRAVRVLRLDLPRTAEPLDTEEHLPELILRADPVAREDLRSQVLEPLEQLRPATAQKLRETLRSWLTHQGRREDVAAELFVHPQTVRYRMQQLREVYGERLDDAGWRLRLTLALA